LERRVTLSLTEDAWIGRFQAMGSPCEVVCESPRRSDAAEMCELVADEAWRIEDKFSRYRDDNVVAQINRAADVTVELDDETADLVDFAATLYQLSDKRFDITSGVLRKAWIFDGSDRVPSQREIDTLLARVGWHRVSWQRPRLTLPTGMEIDLGGIGKEYAVDKAVARIRSAGGGPCLINFGGDLASTAMPCRRRCWKVGIEGKTPDSAERLVDLKEGALASSGDERRFLQKDGIRYSHILDPLTGWPVFEAPRSVTVAAASCTQAGMISTLAMLKGAGAEAFLEAEGVRAWCRRQARASNINIEIT